MQIWKGKFWTSLFKILLFKLFCTFFSQSRLRRRCCKTLKNHQRFGNKMKKSLLKCNFGCPIHHYIDEDVNEEKLGKKIHSVKVLPFHIIILILEQILLYLKKFFAFELKNLVTTIAIYLNSVETNHSNVIHHHLEFLIK